MNEMKRAKGGIPEDVAGVPENVEAHGLGGIPEDVAGVPQNVPAKPVAQQRTNPKPKPRSETGRANP